jgi:phosphate transport system substrate-binding protein
MSVRIRHALLALALLATLLVAVAAPARPAAAQNDWSPRQISGVSLRGSGATFPNPLYQVWISVYKLNVPGVTINYQAVGSGQGITDFINYLTDFGGTDSVVPDARIRTEAPDTLHVPTVMGAVVPTYNLQGVTGLRFRPATLAGIFLGQITRWNHPLIAADNPGVALPDRKITVVRRSDASGTTSVFTDYLSKVSNEWNDRVGRGTTVRWPVGVGAPGNAGVAGTVLLTPGAIGYVELTFALANKLPVPSVANASGNFITPTLESVSAAAEGVPIPDDLRVSITNSPNPRAYPIAAFTYILVREQTYTDIPKAQALTDFIYWGLTEGQGATVRLGYAPLPENVRKLAMGQLRKVKASGVLVFNGPIK